MHDLIVNEEKKLDAKTFKNLNENFKLNQNVLKENLKKNFTRLRKFQTNYFKNCLNENLTNELNQTKIAPKNELISAQSDKINKNDLNQHFLKPFHLALNHFRQNLFNFNCNCENLDSNKIRNENQTLTSNNKQTCIFCHLFYKRDQQSSSDLHSNNNLVNVYHSYCKNPNYVNKLKKFSDLNLNEQISTNDNEKNLFDINDFYIDFDDGLLNNLVNERLNFLFENASDKSKKKPNTNETQTSSCLDPDDPNNFRKLPNLSYEDLKLLCDDILDTDISLELIEGTGLKVKQNENYKRRFSLLSGSYDDKSKLKQFRFDSKPIKFDEFQSKLKTQQRKRKYSTSSIISNTKSSDTSLAAIKPRRRSTRSTSSFSSSSSSASPHFSHNIITGYSNLSFSSSKYDINNIIIPSELMANCKIINFVKPQNVATPKWREVLIEPFRCIENLIEKFDDLVYDNRHELAELKERYHVLHKKLKKQNKNKFDSTKSKSFEDFCQEKFKILVAKIKNDENQKRDQFLMENSEQAESNSNENTNDEFMNKISVGSGLKLKYLEWPYRIFPLSEEEFESIVRQDGSEQDQTKSYISNCFTLKMSGSNSRKSSCSLSLTMGTNRMQEDQSMAES